MVSTKEQERNALEKIRKIVDSLGEGSYLSFAFDGCFEDAERNINDDAAYSWKSRYEQASSDAEHYRKAANKYLEDADNVESQCADLRKQVLSKEELNTIITILDRYLLDRKADMHQSMEKFGAICADASINVKSSDILTPLVGMYRTAKQSHDKADQVRQRVIEILCTYDRTNAELEKGKDKRKGVISSAFWWTK